MRIKTILLLIIILFAIFKLTTFNAQECDEPTIYWPHPRSCSSGIGYGLSKVPDTLQGPKFIYIGKDEGYYSEPPVVYKGKVYLINGSKDLLCIDYKSGSILWAVKGEFGASPVIYRGRVYIPDKDRLRCFDVTTGEEVVTFEGEVKGVIASVAVADGKVVVAKPMFVICYDASTGKIIWKSQGPLSPLAPYIYDNKIVVTDFHEIIICYDLKTGKILWSNNIKKRAHHFHAALANGKVFYAYDESFSNDCCVEARSLDDGKIIWKTKLKNTTLTFIESGPAVAYGKVYVVVWDVPKQGVSLKSFSLFCLDENTGQIIWKVSYPLSIGGKPREVSVADNKVIISIWGEGGEVYCFDANNGNLLWKYANAKYSGEIVRVYTSAAIAEGYVFVIAGVGTRWKDFLLVFGSLKKPSSLSIAPANVQIQYGEEVELSLSLNPPKKATINIEVRYDDESWEAFGKITTDDKGKINFKWKPDKAGKWELKFTWPGDEEYEEAVKIVSITVNKVTPSLSITSSTSASYGKEYKLQIKLNPPIAGVPAIITYISPSNKQYTHGVESDQNGVIQDTFTFDEDGEWTVKVKVVESENSYMTVQEFKVTVKKSLLPFSPLILGAIALGVIVIVAIVVIIIKSRKPKPVYPPPPPPPYPPPPPP